MLHILWDWIFDWIFFFARKDMAERAGEILMGSNGNCSALDDCAVIIQERLLSFKKYSLKSLRAMGHHVWSLLPTG